MYIIIEIKRRQLHVCV